MPQSILPTPGVRDTLGSSTRPWAKIIAQIIQTADGKNYLIEGFDASKIGPVGAINPVVITQLAGATVVQGSGVTLAQIAAAAASGGGLDPAAVINAGATLLTGEKIQDGTLDLSALDPLEKLLQNLLVGNGGALVSDDYDGSTTGFKLSKTELKILLATSVFKGILNGTIAINHFTVDSNGKAIWNDPANGAIGFHVDQDGSVWWGSDTFSIAPALFDPFGNFVLKDGPLSLSEIDLGAINAVCKEVIATPAGGQFSGNLVLTPVTRGATIYYTTDGSDPSNVTNANRQLYTAPFAINPVSGNITVKASAIKLGAQGPTFTWVFTQSATQVAQPTASPIPGFYTSSNPTFAVTLNDGTPGATIKFTQGDGTQAPPSATNGTVYTSPILLPVPSGSNPIVIYAYATKAGLVDSAIASFSYQIAAGAGGGGGTVADPILSPLGSISPGHGFVLVSATDATSGSQMVYTLDGTDPVLSPLHGTLINFTFGLINVPGNVNTVLKIRAFKTGFTPSNIVTQSYFFAP
jgi:Fn3 associated